MLIGEVASLAVRMWVRVKVRMGSGSGSDVAPKQPLSRNGLRQYEDSTIVR